MASWWIYWLLSLIELDYPIHYLKDDRSISDASSDYTWIDFVV